MTFQEFKTLCDDAVATSQPVKSPCPIVIGDPAQSVKGSYGDAPDHHLVIFTEPPDNAALKPIVQSVRFSFEAGTNETVITPITTGAGA
jgi:hypothetical protein